MIHIILFFHYIGPEGSSVRVVYRISGTNPLFLKFRTVGPKVNKTRSLESDYGKGIPLIQWYFHSREKIWERVMSESGRTVNVYDRKLTENPSFQANCDFDFDFFQFFYFYFSFLIFGAVQPVKCKAECFMVVIMTHGDRTFHSALYVHRPLMSATAAWVVWKVGNIPHN